MLLAQDWHELKKKKKKKKKKKNFGFVLARFFFGFLFVLQDNYNLNWWVSENDTIIIAK
jgi:hypothetical protein